MNKVFEINSQVSAGLIISFIIFILLSVSSSSVEAQYICFAVSMVLSLLFLIQRIALLIFGIGFLMIKFKSPESRKTEIKN